MQSIIQRSFNMVREELGHPYSLRKLLLNKNDVRFNLDEPFRCISVSSVPHWHELGAHSVFRHPVPARGSLMGWRHVGNNWSSFQIERPEFSKIASHEIKENWSCDLQEIDGFCASKSNLSKFSSTDAMVEANSPELIDAITVEKLEKNLSHNEIRILHSHRSSDYFKKYLWDGRLWLMNDGGAHHTAAAKLIASRLGQQVPLVGTLHTHSLNAHAVESLRHDFEIFAISDATEVAMAFFEAMRAVRATWLWSPMPRPFESAKAIYLPKKETRSMRVAEELSKAGIIDLGAHLADLIKKQAAHCQAA